MIQQENIIGKRVTTDEFILPCSVLATKSSSRYDISRKCHVNEDRPLVLKSVSQSNGTVVAYVVFVVLRWRQHVGQFREKEITWMRVTSSKKIGLSNISRIQNRDIIPAILGKFKVKSIMG